jgi:hypothetical protein
VEALRQSRGQVQRQGPRGQWRRRLLVQPCVYIFTQCLPHTHHRTRTRTRKRTQDEKRRLRSLTL